MDISTTGRQGQRPVGVSSTVPASSILAAFQFACFAIACVAMSAMLVLAMTGCAASLPVDNRTPEQIAASAKDKSAVGECVVLTSIYGVVRSVRVSVDKSSLGTNGAVVSIDPDTCRTSIQILPKAASAP